MNGKEMVEKLTAMIQEHGDLPVLDGWGKAVTNWAFLRAEDSDEMDACVYFYGGKTDAPIVASAVLKAYITARDASASNEEMPWDEQWIKDESESDQTLVYYPADDSEPAVFQFEG